MWRRYNYTYKDMLQLALMLVSIICFVYLSTLSFRCCEIVLNAKLTNNLLENFMLFACYSPLFLIASVAIFHNLSTAALLIMDILLIAMIVIFRDVINFSILPMSAYIYADVLMPIAICVVFMALKSRREATKIIEVTIDVRKRLHKEIADMQFDKAARQLSLHPVWNQQKDYCVFMPINETFKPHDIALENNTNSLQLQSSKSNTICVSIKDNVLTIAGNEDQVKDFCDILLGQFHTEAIMEAAKRIETDKFGIKF